MSKTLTATAPPDTQKNRRYYNLDWVRVLAFLILIFYHTGMLFCTWDWHIKNPETSEDMNLWMRFFSQWRMSLLFLVSGASIVFALRGRNLWGYIKERHLRLLVPLLFGMFVVVPPQVYFERLSQGKFHSFLEFYPHVFEFQPYPQGNFSWHHLWYLPYVLVFSMIGMPLFFYMRSNAGKQLVNRIAAVMGGRLSIWLMLVPLAVSDILLRAHWKTTNNLTSDWANFSFSLMIFLFGFLFNSSQRFWDTLIANRHISLLLGIGMTVFLYTFFWIPKVDIFEASYPYLDWCLYWCYKDLNILCWLFAILGYSFRHLNFSNGFLKYASEAVYPFYILHQTVIVGIGYYIVQWPLGIWTKFAIVSVGNFLICLFLYEIIRRINILRPFFGLKMQ